MSITNLQNKTIVIGSPIEVEFAVNEIRKQLINIPWIDRPYFIAQRFARDISGKKFLYPETYAPEQPGSRNYQRLTPDNDFKGMFFFWVGSSINGTNDQKNNFIKYPVSIIFSVNLELINKPKLDQGLFTQELIRDVRRMLMSTMAIQDFQYIIKSETRDLREVYKEFVLDDLESYNRAPMQCFRFDLELNITEGC